MSEDLATAFAADDMSDGELPESLPDEFHDAWRTEVKRRTDAQTALRNRQPSVPESYELTLDDAVREAFVAGDDDPLLSAFTAAAQDAQLTQEQFDRIVSGYEGVAKEALASQLTPARLRDQLAEVYGDETEKTIQSVSNFLDAALPDSNLHEAAVRMALGNPDAFLVYDAFRQLLKERTVPSRPGGQTGPATPQEELQQLVHGDAYRAGERGALRRATELVRLAEAAEAAQG